MREGILESPANVHYDPIPIAIVVLDDELRKSFAGKEFPPIGQGIVEPTEVQRIARLARLKLTDDEIAALTDDLGRILEYVAILNEVDTDDVAPMAHAVEQANVFRPDEVAPSLPREAALQNAPRTDGAFFLVPKILDGAG